MFSFSEAAVPLDKFYALKERLLLFLLLLLLLYAARDIVLWKGRNEFRDIVE